MHKAFTHTNKKLIKTAKALGVPTTHVVGFNMPSGWTCPGANECKAKADRITGKVTPGKKAQFRCYMASIECLSKSLRNQAWNNFEAVKGKSSSEIATWLHQTLLKEYPNVKYVRPHPGGDFFSQYYFDGWLKLAKIMRPDLQFWAYTKSIPFWIQRLDIIPDNFHLVASMGGKYDDLALQHNLRKAIVVTEPHPELPTYATEADSEIAMLQTTGDFALMIHGTQRKEYMKYEWKLEQGA